MDSVLVKYKTHISKTWKCVLFVANVKFDKLCGTIIKVQFICTDGKAKRTRFNVCHKSLTKWPYINKMAPLFLKKYLQMSTPLYSFKHRVKKTSFQLAGPICNDWFTGRQACTKAECIKTDTPTTPTDWYTAIVITCQVDREMYCDV